MAASVLFFIKTLIMVTAIKNDKGLVINILTAAFLDNKSVNYLIPQNGMKMFYIQQLMDYAFEVCRLFGKIYISDDGRACALILYPELKKTTIKSILLDLKLIFHCIGVKNILKAISRENKVKSKQPKEKKAYLWFIAVDPKFQKLGHGRQLLEEIIAKCASEDRPIYLETSTMENLPWYKNFGFEIYDNLVLTYTLFFLKRPI